MDAVPPGFSRHQYDELSAPFAIRLLILLPADSFEAPLTCKLETTDLLSIVQSGVHDKTHREAEQAFSDMGDAHDDLAFEALSYTWGSSQYTGRINLEDDKFLSITANLEAFLRYRRDKNRLLRLWVDAVCIDQENIAERNAQVRNMSLLYAAAPRLTIWLGAPDVKSDAAMQELKNLSTKHPFAKLDPMHRDVFTAIEELLTRDWWRRVWIIQELRFGANYGKRGKTRVLCGQEDIEWLSLILACARLKLRGNDWRRGSPAVDNALLLDTLAQTPFTSYGCSSEENRTNSIQQLLHHVVDFRHFRATNPRDKIFALSGMMMSAQYQGQTLPVMYERSTEQVYTFFATTVIELTKDLSVLSHCQKQPNSMVSPTTLPSWVPDWSSPIQTKPLPMRQPKNEQTVPWWSLPDFNVSKEGPVRFRMAEQKVLREVAKDFLKSKNTWKFGTLPSWLADTLPTEMMSALKKLMARPDFFVCAFDEGDVMDGENLTSEEALSRRIKTSEQVHQRRFLQGLFEEERRARPQFRAGGDRSSEFQISEDLANLTVKGIVCDEIQTIHEPFVANLNDDWTNPTRLMVAIGRCKASVRNRSSSTSPYQSEQDSNKAFWMTIFAGQKLQSLKATLDSTGWSTFLPDTVSTRQKDVWSSWLPETPSAWQSTTPTLTVLESDRLESIERAMAIVKVTKIMHPDETLQFMMRGTVVDKLELIDSEWTDDQRSHYAKQFKELGELWQTQPYDLYHRPLDLPFVVPDPYWETRKITDQDAKQLSISYRHNMWTSAVIMDDSSQTQRSRKLIMEEIKKQPAMTPQGLESVQLVQYALGRRFCVTKNGYFGLAPPAAEIGDKVALIQGADVPFILRKSDDAYELIGEAYVDGLMHGEVMEQWQRVLKELPRIFLR